MNNEYKVISFSLYGNDRLYCEGAVKNIEVSPLFYPGWTCRFYVDETVPVEYISRIAEFGAEIVYVKSQFLGPMQGRYWRFRVAADQRVDRFIIRDADSRLNSREQAAVEEWIGSGKRFHVMRDC